MHLQLSTSLTSRPTPMQVRWNQPWHCQQQTYSWLELQGRLQIQYFYQSSQGGSSCPLLQQALWKQHSSYSLQSDIEVTLTWLSSRSGPIMSVKSVSTSQQSPIELAMCAGRGRSQPRAIRATYTNGIDPYRQKTPFRRYTPQHGGTSRTWSDSQNRFPRTMIEANRQLRGFDSARNCLRLRLLDSHRIAYSSFQTWGDDFIYQSENELL